MLILWDWQEGNCGFSRDLSGLCAWQPQFTQCWNITYDMVLILLGYFSMITAFNFMTG